MSAETHTEPWHPSSIEYLGVYSSHIKITWTQRLCGPESTEMGSEPTDLRQISPPFCQIGGQAFLTCCPEESRRSWHRKRQANIRTRVCKTLFPLPLLALLQRRAASWMQRLPSCLGSSLPPPPPPRVLAQKLGFGLPGEGSFFVESPSPPPHSARWTLVFKNSYLFA